MYNYFLIINYEYSSADISESRIIQTLYSTPLPNAPPILPYNHHMKHSLTRKSRELRCEYVKFEQQMLHILRLISTTNYSSLVSFCASCVSFWVPFYFNRCEIIQFNYLNCGRIRVYHNEFYNAIQPKYI
jgi:hypothetical protein